MTLRLHNTLSRSKETFVPREEGKVFMYVCGPTVYNHIHIGNARTFLSFDLIRRYLEYRGFDVRFVQNLTDVDDKIINRAAEEGRSAAEVAAEYTESFISTMRALGVEDPTVRPKATEMIPQMIDLIERLIAGGHAYESAGDVYFDVRSFPGYGKLSGRNVEEMETQARIDHDDRKRDPLDFALWKSAKPGEPHWTSPWGEGRPGWHIECSAMSEVELGLPFDIHGGGSDLVFPHHENEIAQSEAATGKPFANYWLHGGMLNINSEKMSKSLGNFTLAKDVLAYCPVPVLRLLMLQTHYRSQLEFSSERLDEARTAYERLSAARRRWRAARPAPGSGAPEADRLATAAAVADARARFVADMDDDFNSAGALGALFELTRTVNGFASSNESVLSDADLVVISTAADTLEELLAVMGAPLPLEQILGFTQTADGVVVDPLVELAAEVASYAGTDHAEAEVAILAKRAAARAAKDWPAADALRERLTAIGYTVEDGASGSRLVAATS